MNKNILLAMAAFLAAGTLPGFAGNETAAGVLQDIEKVNDLWQSCNNKDYSSAWNYATYYTGNMAAYRLTGKAQYYAYSDRWCRHNNWAATPAATSALASLTTSPAIAFNASSAMTAAPSSSAMVVATSSSAVKAQWQRCYQVYKEMYSLVPGDYKLANVKDVDYLANDSLLWDKGAQHTYRDGCLFAGMAELLADMPRDHKDRKVYLERFKRMADDIARSLQTDNSGNTANSGNATNSGNVANSGNATNSGNTTNSGNAANSGNVANSGNTDNIANEALFCYGMLWGVNHGQLDRSKYASVIDQLWENLADTKQLTDKQDPFCTGSWLMAACEMVRYLDGTASQQMLPGKPRTASGGKTLKVTVNNVSGNNRSDVVEMDAKDIFAKLGIAGGRQIVVTDGDGVERPYQLTADGKLLIQAFVAPHAVTSFTLTTGEPQDFRLDCNGRIYPNREDDLTWENDKCAWRMYGPKMHNKGVSGFDTFAKNVTYPIQDVLYNSELTSYGINAQLRKAGRGGEWTQVHRDMYTYHRDRGQGMDAYTVGNTLGAGAPAVMKDGKLIMPDVYERAEIQDNGPLRFTVRLQMYDQNGIKETRTFKQDKGTHLARVEVEYDGIANGTDVASGIVVHKSQPAAYVINRNAGYIAYSDALDTPQGQNGQLFIGCLYTQKMKAMKYVALPEEKAGGIGHVIGQTTYTAGKPFIYYAGSAWSKYDVPTMAVWEQMLKYYAENLKTPLKVEYEVEK